MRSKLNFFSDEKFRSIFFQTLVIGLFALGIFFIVQTTAYNLEKRNIARKEKKFSDADNIRDKLNNMGIEIEDKSEGTIWRSKN